MSGNRLLIAFAVLVVLLGLTVWKWKARESEDLRPPDVTVALPKVQKDAVDGLEVAVPGKTPVKLEKKDGKWRLSQPVSAPADDSAVSAAVDKLAELESLGVAATREDSHKQLEVDEAQAVHVAATAGGKTLADVLIGAYRSGNTMVRPKGSVTVATAKGSIKFAFDKDVKDWRDRSIVDVPLDNVKDALFQNANGVFRFVNEAGTWKQAAGEKAIAGFDGEQVKSILGSATNLSATDFASAGVTAEAAGVGAAALGVVRFTATSDKGAEEVLLRVGQKIDTNYYLAREGHEPVYVVSQFVGDRLLPTAEKFAKAVEPAADGGKKPPVSKTASRPAAKPAAK